MPPARALALLLLFLASPSVYPAVTSTVVDVPRRSGFIRVLIEKPDAPVATLIVMTGGDGVLALTSDGRSGRGAEQFDPIWRNHQIFTDAGIALAFVDVSSSLASLNNVERASTGYLEDFQAVVAEVRAMLNTRIWVFGFSAGSISVVNLGVNSPEQPAFGVIMMSPVTVGGGNILTMNVAALRHPTFVLSHASDECGLTPPSQVPAFMAQLTAAPAKEHVEYTGGNAEGGGCSGYHSLSGLDRLFGAQIVTWVNTYAGLLKARNFQSLWWKSPAGSESGWGVNLTHQGDILFGTWFTYDTDGSGMWLVMPNGMKTANDTYSGALFRTTGPPFSAASFNPAQVGVTQVGSATFTFTDANNATFAYTVSGITQSKPITRQIFSGPVPDCGAGGTAGSTLYYQDLWWRSPAGSESGWGVNITHQGDIVFATWFTYGADGRGMWLVMPNGAKTAAGTYSGALYRTTGPAFNATPWTGTVGVTQVGAGTFTFSDANNGTFAYTVDGIVQSKAITRQVYSNPPTVCR